MRLLSAATLAAALTTTLFAADLMPAAEQTALILKYCAVCHTDAARNGGLTLQHFDAAHLDPSLAAMLVSKLRTGAMGASGIPMPERPTINALTTALDAASANAHQWTITPDAATLTASILRALPSATNPRSVYRLVLACDAATHQADAQLTWAPTATTGTLSAAIDSKPPVTFKVEGSEAMGNGMPGQMQPAFLKLPNLGLPAQTLTISNLFPGETVVFPFDTLPQPARQSLAACFPRSE